MRELKTSWAMAILAATVIAMPLGAQTPPDVPREHWAYSAVEDLAAKGLIKGYPPAGNFFGKRTVTRYEMATIIQRALARVDELLAKKSDKGGEPQGVGQAQLDEVRKLVSDFRVELTVIGTDLQKVKDQIGELNEKVAAAQQSADAAKSAADKAGADAAAAKEQADTARQGIQGMIDALGEQRNRIDTLNTAVNSHKISGYAQLRFESFDQGRTSLFTPTGAGGTGQTPSIGGPAVGGPYYGFLARRVRLKISGPIGSSGRTDYGIQIDAPSFGAINLKEAYANVRNLPAQNLTLTAGQFAPPFGWEIPYSSSTRESPERAIAFTDTNASSPIFKTSQAALGGTVTPGSVISPFINQEYDQGAMLTYARHGFSMPGTPGDKISLMALNGFGSSPTGIRNLKNGVDLILRGQKSFLGGKLTLGASGYYGQMPVRGAAPGAGGAVAPFVNGIKELAGADVNYLTPWGTSLRAEYVGGVFEATPDRALFLENNHMQGWLFAARHPISKKLEAAIKYDEYMPISQGGKHAGGLSRMELIRKTIQGGLLYSIDDATRFRLWYQRGLTPYDPSASSGPLRGRLGFVTAELQVKY